MDPTTHMYEITRSYYWALRLYLRWQVLSLQCNLSDVPLTFENCSLRQLPAKTWAIHSVNNAYVTVQTKSNLLRSRCILEAQWHFPKVGKILTHIWNREKGHRPRIWNRRQCAWGVKRLTHLHAKKCWSDFFPNRNVQQIGWRRHWPIFFENKCLEI